MAETYEETSSPADARFAEPAEGTPPRRLRHRLWFAWVMAVAMVATVPFALLQFIGHQFDPTARNFKRWASGWARAILRPAGIRVWLKEHVSLSADQPYVFVSNHQNMVDILVLAAGLRQPFGFVAKAELARVPALGLAIRHSASLFIDRSTPRRSVETLKAAGERIRNGNSVLVFPEGARSYAPVVYPFKRGAFMVAVEAGVPVVPVTIRDAYRVLDERRKVARPGDVHVVVGAPIAITGTRRGDIPALMAQVLEQMEADLADVDPAGYTRRV